MARKTKQERMAGIHETALACFSAAHAATEDQRDLSAEDRRFHTVAGAQWDGAIGAQFENKIKIEADKVHRQILRAETEYRENRITVDFVSREGDEDDDVADLCDGLFRADAHDSQAEEAFDTAFSEGLSGGFGAWRLSTEYVDEEDDEDDRQRIVFVPVYEADQSVFFDPNAKLYDKSDARYAFIVTPMTPEAYEDEWDDDPASWPVSTDTNTGDFLWSRPDAVYVAEYFVKEETTETIYRFMNPAGDVEVIKGEDMTEDAETDLAQRGFAFISEKKKRIRRIHKYILSGGGILEDCGYIPGTELPIIPFYGQRTYSNGSEHWMGMVRKAKDPQRLYNMQVSALAGISARGGVDKPILTPEQVAGHETVWAMDAVNDYAYLPLNSIDGPNGEPILSGPVGIKPAPQIPPALAALIQTASTDIADSLGNMDQGDEYSANLSGKAIELVQNRLDRQVYIYMSNFAKSMRVCGKVWLSMAREIYVEPRRKMRVMDSQDIAGFETINTPRLTGEGLDREGFSLKNAKFDVAVDVGATSSSARSATVRALASLLPMVGDPQAQQVMLATIGRNLEGEGISGMREYFRRVLVKMGVEEPTDADKEEAANAPPQQPSAQDIYLQSEAVKSQAEAEKVKAETVETIADTALAEARTVETLAGVENNQLSTAVDAAAKLREAATTPPPEQGREQRGSQ